MQCEFEFGGSKMKKIFAAIAGATLALAANMGAEAQAGRNCHRMHYQRQVICSCNPGYDQSTQIYDGEFDTLPPPEVRFAQEQGSQTRFVFVPAQQRPMRMIYRYRMMPPPMMMGGGYGYHSGGFNYGNGGGNHYAMSYGMQHSRMGYSGMMHGGGHGMRHH